MIISDTWITPEPDSALRIHAGQSKRGVSSLGQIGSVCSGFEIGNDLQRKHHESCRKEGEK
jgi:hypothetical protein